MKERRLPGIELVVIENGQVAMHQKVGVKNSQTFEPLTNETLFEAASLSKPLFAYAVLKLVEKDVLNLDIPLVDYLAYPGRVSDLNLNLVTTRMILTHTSGFPNWQPKNESLTLHSQPGKKFGYSGESFSYLQKVVEHLTQQSLEEFMQQLVFKPLRMSNSTFIWINSDQKSLGHDLNGLPIESDKIFLPNAAFTLHTTGLDYAKFIIAILQETELLPETHRILLQSHIQADSDFISWGLGWGLQQTELGDSFWHWGDNQKFKNFAVGFKKQRRGIIILTNGAKGLSAISRIIQKFIGLRLPAFQWLHQKYHS